MAFGVNSSGGFNIGTDLSVVITNNSTGAQLPLDGRRTSFEASDGSKVEEGTAVDRGGLTDVRIIPGRWTGSLEVERNSDGFSAVYAQQEAAFFAGSPDTRYTIYVYEPTPDRAGLAEYQFTDVAFHGYKAGPWGKSAVKTTVQFTAQQRIKVA